MGYIKTTRAFKYAIEYTFYHTGRYGAPGQKRQKKKKPTDERQKRINQTRREDKARWKLRANFDTNDYFIRLSYRKEERPEDMAQAKEDFKKFIRKLREEYKKRGHTLKWMRNIEVGTRNAWHVHLVINRIPDADILVNRLWGHGSVNFKLLYEKGEFRELAAYITKTPETDSRLREADYSASKNLPYPEAVKKKYPHWRTWHRIQIPSGYYLDEESFHEGINPVTGYKYRSYTVFKLSGRELRSD